MRVQIRRWLRACLVEARGWLQRHRGDIVWLLSEVVVSTVVSYLITLM